MPANLTPEYHRAEERFRTARSAEEKLEALEEMLRVMPKHKGTDHLQAELKTKIAKLRKEGLKKGVKSGFSYMVPREGAGQVALAGPPSSGKSSLVRALTHAEPEVADYPFTTREPVPGMMAFEEIAIQLVDLPPVSGQHAEPWVFDLIRRSDLVWIVVNGSRALEDFDETRGLVESRHMPLFPAGTRAPEPATTSDLPKKSLLVVTGLDRAGVAEAIEAVDELLERRWPIVATSAVGALGLDELRRRTFDALEIVRVFTKQPGKPADRRSPFTVPQGSTIAELAGRIHNDVLAQMKFARVWGAGVFDGQTVQRDHVLSDRDVVEIHT